MFDKFKEEKGGEMMEERIEENVSEEESVEASPNSESTIGIGELMGKRAKLEEAIDYVGLMIKNLKDKRTMLEKDIEEEAVDIKNLKEKFDKYTDTLLYLAARNEHISHVIKPSLVRNKIVICDRFVDSTVAYQTFGKKVDINFVNFIHRYILVFYLKNFINQ